jgi:hypothetical protein
MAVERREAALGENGWALGCRSYAFACHAIAQAAQSGDAPWLEVIEGLVASDEGIDTSLRFTFTVGGVPIKFYRAKQLANAPSRTVARTFIELQQQQSAFAFAGEYIVDTALRIAVQTDEEGHATDIHLVQVASDTEVIDSWLIPALESANIVPFTHVPEATVLAPPQVGSWNEDEQEQGSDSSA